MSFPILQKFFGHLNEAQEKAPDGPVDLKDVAKYFPKNAQKAVNNLNRNDRLAYAGKSVFDELYSDIEDAAKRKIGRDQTTEMSVDFEGTLKDKKGNDVEAYIETVEVEVGDMQEVYLGYHPQSDVFVMGFDAWINEEDFWEELEKQFKTQGVNTDSEDFDEACNGIWNKVKATMMCSIMVQLEISDSGKVKATKVDDFFGGWYSRKFGGHMQVKDIYPGILDVRLD